MKKIILVWSLLLFSLSAVTAQRSLTGSIVDEKSEPLIGASVLIKGTSLGTVSDLDGKFKINISDANAILVISFTGYTTQEVNLQGASNVISVRLEPDQKLLDEVVVTALGISRSERSLSYGVSQVDGDNIVKSGEVNAIQGLAAKAPGVQIIGSGGTPGASSKILIRGNRSFTGNNQPLIIVDGIPYDNSTNTSVARDYPFNANLQGVNNSNRALDLNPNDIESVNLLKGPAATALYGSRAANGVLQIITKKGSKSKNKFNVSLNSSIDIAEVNKLPKLQSKYAQGNGGGIATDNVIKDAGNYITFVPGVTNGVANSWGPLIGSADDARFAKSYDNFDAYFRKGYTYDNGISFSGGNDLTSFRVSYGNTTQSGIVPNTDLKRNSVRINAQTGTEKFKVTGGVAYTNTSGTKGQNGSNISGVMLALTRMPANFNILGGTGENGYTEADGTQHRYIGNYDNPFWSVYNNENKDVVNRITGNIGLVYSPFDWFSVSYKIGADNYNTQVKQNWAIGSNNTNPAGEIQENTLNWGEVNSDLILSFKHKVSNDLDLGLNLGNNMNVRKSKDLFARGSNLTIPNFYNFSNASVFYGSELSTERRIAGFFGDLSVGYKNMLYLNAAARHDWASTFGAENRENGFFYPSLGLSFIFSELLPKNDILTYGKIRASHSKAGNEPIPYSTRTYYNQPFFTDGFTDGLGLPYNGVTGFGLSSTLGDKNLQPETTKAFEVGLELKMLSNRVGLDFTFYNQKSENLLLFRPIASTSGFGQIFTNAGSMRNKGLEIALNVDVIKTENISWNLGLNWSKNENEVLSLADGVDEINIESAFASIGSYAIVKQPYGALYGTKWERNDAGQLIFEDGVPKISTERGNLGNPYPDWIMGITSGLNVYGVNLSILFDIRQGGVLWGGTYARLNNIGRTEESANRNQFYQVSGVDTDGNPVVVDMDPQTYFRYFKGDAGGATENAVFDGSWLRLRELSLSYDFKISKYVNSLTAFATGRNLWLSTDYPGVDPETSLTGAGSNVGGFDYFNMPGTKSYQFGIRVSF